MTENDYWARLEFCVCHEFARMNHGAVRFLWCDGLTPEQYFVGEASPRIIGLAWIGNGQKQDRWVFELILDNPIPRTDDVPWDALLPAEDSTGWLFVDLDARRIRIDPSSRQSA